MNFYHSHMLQASVGVISIATLIVVLVLAAVEVARLHATALAGGARQRARSLAIDTLGDLALTATELHGDVPSTNTEAANLSARSLAREARLVILPLLRAFHLRLVEDRHADPDRQSCHSHADCH